MSRPDVKRGIPWAISPKTLSCLSPFHRNFTELELARTPDLYRRRCEFIGLIDHAKVLDAGCGVGQWACALGELNEQVEGVDVESNRLWVATELARSRMLPNVGFRWASLEQLPYADGEFDAVFCYSVIMFTRMRVSLREFRRVLRPGGSLYVMVDLWRWHWDRLRTGHLPKVEFVKMAIKRICRFDRGGLYGRRWYLNQIASAGFRVVRDAQEGCVCFWPETRAPNPELVFFRSQPPGREQLLEVAALAD